MSIIGLETREFSSCEELLKHLLFDDVWGRRQWKYRGQGNKDDELVPSALRRDTKFFSDDEQPAQSNKVQILREWTVLKRFMTFADHQGLPIPGVDVLFNDLSELNWLVHRSMQGEQRWPLKRLYGLMALAQHYGVPTRILDWTRAPLIGLYFAAAYAAQEENEKPQITLYALNEEIYYLHLLAFNDKYESQVSKIEATLIGIDVPYAKNPNITAQTGTFTCIAERRINPEHAVPIRNLEGIIVELAQVVNRIEDLAAMLGMQTDPMLIKLIAPGDDAGRLLRKLASTFHIMGGTVFPGFDGAAKAVHERRLWDQKWSDDQVAIELQALALLNEAKAKP